MKDAITSPTAALTELLSIMQALRNPQSGCPWDLEQSFSTIAPHTLEEAYEVIDAVESDNMRELPGELGDLLFQVVFYAQLGAEEGLFDIGDVLQSINTKLLTRHPHVFPDATLASAGSSSPLNSEQVALKWESIKAEERARKTQLGYSSVLDDVPEALGALLRAAKLQKRAANVGFDWTDVQSVQAKVDEERKELQQAIQAQDSEGIEEEFGDLLFTMVNLSRHLGINPESALRKANRKFESRFRKLEDAVLAAGSTVGEKSLAELDQFWDEVKRQE